MKTVVSLLIVSFAITTLLAQKELGTVNWLRNYDEATAQATAQDKPILLLFQEVPGCSTCVNYGEQVLSHPLLVDAIENEFIPLAIYNNVDGHDRKILNKYKEPTWNNPVVRIVKSNGDNVIERLAGNYSAAGLASQMSFALKALGKGVPSYLALIEEELSAQKKETAYYEMYCFWSGEAHLGSQPGVIATEPGFMNGAEVVKVTYDESELNKKDLDKFAAQAKCQVVNKVSTYSKDKDPQYYLKKSAYQVLPLSPMQKTKINAALKAGADAKQYLSPTQKAYLEQGRGGQALYDLPLAEAWAIAFRS